MNSELPLDTTILTDIPRRHHSQQLVSTISDWDSILEKSSLSDSNTFQQFPVESLNKILAEASFLGFPQTVKLARAVRASIQRVQAQDRLTNPSSQSIRRALETLKQIVVEDRQFDTRDVLTLVRDLQTEFSFTETELNASVDVKLTARPTDLTTGSERNQSFTEHRDLEVYRNSRLDSLDQCIEEESWIVSQLASLAEDLASGTNSNHPAARLMYVLKNHKLFNQVDRVCLVGRVSGANQLVVVDASISERCSENSLKKGYSCFVNPEGSLFKMRPGTVRMFGDCETVLSSFAAQGKPAQRSIALISDSGLRSGRCLALGRGTDVQGFLFLNSVQEDLFREISVQSAPILSLFGLIATITLDTHGFHLLPKNHPHHEDRIPKSSIPFEANELQLLLEQALAVRHRPGLTYQLKIHTKSETPAFLYLPTTIVNSLAELIARVHAPGTEVTVEVGISNSQIHMGFTHLANTADTATGNWLTRIAKSLDAEFSNKPVSIMLTDSHLIIEFPFEPVLAGYGALRYSTVY